MRMSSGKLSIGPWFCLATHIAHRRDTAGYLLPLSLCFSKPNWSQRTTPSRHGGKHIRFLTLHNFADQGYNWCRKPLPTLSGSSTDSIMLHHSSRGSFNQYNSFLQSIKALLCNVYQYGWSPHHSFLKYQSKSWALWRENF